MSTGTDLALELKYGLNIVSWCRDRVRFKPDPWQERVLSTDAPQVLLNICRQGGKSTICALRAAHMAIYRPGTLTLLISRGQRQAGEIYQIAASPGSDSTRLPFISSDDAWLSTRSFNL